MGGFMGDIAKPVGKMLTFGHDVIPRPETSSERTAIKQKFMREEAERKRQVLAAEARKREAMINYKLPSNVRQRAEVAAMEAGESGRRASQFLGS